MISNAKRATTIVKMQTVMRPLSELAVGSLSFVLSFVSSGLYHPISTTGRTGGTGVAGPNHQTWSV